jgi:NAD-dependent dihydropyrimidine dehydrogenase PreA subunit
MTYAIARLCGRGGPCARANARWTASTRSVGRSLYIQPDACVGCGVCEPVCPADAIVYEHDLPRRLMPYVSDEASFSLPLLGRTGARGSPGGAASSARWGDTTLAAGPPPFAEVEGMQ